MVSNAGGVNPHACVTALLETARDQGVELSVATVTGDNFIDKVCTYVYTCNTCVNAIEMEPYTHCTVCTEDTPELRTPLNRPIFLPKILLLHITWVSTSQMRTIR